jgi:DNA-binding transcriptional MerR regulator/effector-binding domain-containing protein
MLSIGDFSKVTKLTVKTIRLYHDRGLLVPAVVDDATGYRSFDQRNIETARIISALKELQFSLEEIAGILDTCRDEMDLAALLEKQRAVIEARLATLTTAKRTLEIIINREKEARRAMTDTTFEVHEKTIDAMIVAGSRFKGKYADVGPAFGTIARKVGRHVAGPAMSLYYDAEFKEDGADIEACFPVKRVVRVEGLDVRELAGGRCLSLMYQGPYEEISRGYAKLFEFVNAKGLKTKLPSREIYVKGPGMIFRGNPKKYLTELQVLLEG